MNGLPKPVYVMSEKHLPGYRVIIGYETPSEAQDAQAALCKPPARSGKVTWHSSGEDEGPDVGLQLDLGHGRSLWLGEGQKPNGWQFSLVQGDDIIPVADVIDHEQARDLFDLIASAVQPPARDLAAEVDDVKRTLETDGQAIEYFEAQRRVAAFKALRGTEADKRAVSYIDAAILALQAREDVQPVAWPESDPVYVSAMRVLKGTTGWDEHARDLTARLIAKNTHPSPDALRVAVEALEAIRDTGSDGEHSGDRHARCRDIARQALVALKAKGGAK